MTDRLERTQFIANIATALTLILTLIVFIRTSHSERKEIEYRSFLTLLEQYQKIAQARHDGWVKIRETVRANPKTKDEVPDSQDTLSYLMLRAKQL